MGERPDEWLHTYLTGHGVKVLAAQKAQTHVALDKRTVELRLTAPRATFLLMLAAPPAAVVDPTDLERGADWWRDLGFSAPDWASASLVSFAVAAALAYPVGRLSPSLARERHMWQQRAKERSDC